MQNPDEILNKKAFIAIKFRNEENLMNEFLDECSEHFNLYLHTCRVHLHLTKNSIEETYINNNHYKTIKLNEVAGFILGGNPSRFWLLKDALNLYNYDKNKHG